MSAEFIAILIIGAACGGFVNGMAGFGTSLFALGWWLQIMPPIQAVALSLAMSVLSGVQGVIVVRREIRFARLAVFTLPALVGVPIGLQILHLVNAGVLKLVVASFLLLYGGFFLFRSDLPAMQFRSAIVDGAIGFVAGILGAIAGLSGALPTMWLALRDWTKRESRAVLQPFNVIVLGVSGALLAVQGAYDRQTLILLAVAAPSTMLAAQVGIWLFGRLSDHQFRRLLIGLMFVSGALILIREAF